MTAKELRERLAHAGRLGASMESVRIVEQVARDAITTLEEREREIARLRDELAQCAGYDDYADYQAADTEETHT